MCTCQTYCDCWCYGSHIPNGNNERSEIHKACAITPRKRGGIWLDSDVVVTGSFSSIRNAVALQSQRLSDVATGVLVFDKGSRFLEYAMRLAMRQYKKDSWDSIGPMLFLNVMHYAQKEGMAVCRVSSEQWLARHRNRNSNRNRGFCYGNGDGHGEIDVYVLPYQAFYPVNTNHPVLRPRVLFEFSNEEHKQIEPAALLAEAGDSLALHIWAPKVGPCMNMSCEGISYVNVLYVFFESGGGRTERTTGRSDIHSQTKQIMSEK